MTDYLTPAQLCTLVPGTKPNYWAQLRFTGKGPAYLKPSPKKVLYLERDVTAWLEGTRRTGTAVAA